MTIKKHEPNLCQIMENTMCIQSQTRAYIAFFTISSSSQSRVVHIFMAVLSDTSSLFWYTLSNKLLFAISQHLW